MTTDPKHVLPPPSIEPDLVRRRSASSYAAEAVYNALVLVLCAASLGSFVAQAEYRYVRRGWGTVGASLSYFGEGCSVL